MSCNDSKKQLLEEKHHMEFHEEMDKISEEYQKFETILVKLYDESIQNPQKTLLKTDSLLAVNKNEKDYIKSKNKDGISSQLHYLKSEIYYKIGDYKKSITELDFEKHKKFDIAVAYASNYIKLKQFEKAKSFIDSIGKGYYIYDYALGNYNESIGNKIEALKIYEEIKKDKEIKHYAYYKLAVSRVEELKKNNSKLLNEIYYPTRNPNFEIVDSDDENRTKIFKMISEIPETKGKSVWIFESPQINDKDYYWIKVGESNGFSDNEFKTELNFYIYPKNFEIKYYDEKSKKLISMEEWKNKKNSH